MKNIGVIYGGHDAHYRTFHESKFNQYISKIIYHPEFLNADISDLDVLIVPSQLNGNLLLQSKDKIISFAEEGGTVVALGPQPWEWIPGQNWEFRPTNFWWWLEENPRSGLILSSPEHSLFTKYLTLKECTWHQHGVFWAPSGAEVLISTEDGGAVMYEERLESGGRWLVTTLDPDYHFGSYFMPVTERFLEGFFPYLKDGR